MKEIEIVIVGSGFGGLCMAARLKQGGMDDFVILEKADSAGGTWRENRYPGAECDVPSALYSYSFAPNPTWDFKWARQPQILGYLQDFAGAQHLERHLLFGQTVADAKFIEDQGKWQVRTQTGREFLCRFLIFAVGQLHHPRIPDFAGQASFAGESFHSATWPDAFSAAGKRVAVVGNAASAIQLIPELAATAARLCVYQRSANWILPKGDRPYSRLEKWLASFLPALAMLYRLRIWCLGEFGLYPIIAGSTLHKAWGKRRCKTAIERAIADPALRVALLPDYPIGAKRILFSDRYYATLARDNVELVLAPISAITAGGIEDALGHERHHDAIVYATGFRTNPFLSGIDVHGPGGQRLHDRWRLGSFAYLGVMTAGFPNLFLLYGPNTNTGHTSVVLKLEAQARYIDQLIRKAGPRTIAVRPDQESMYNDEIQARLKKLAWAKVGNSWYMDGDRITNNWPGSSIEYRRRMREPEWAHFELS